MIKVGIVGYGFAGRGLHSYLVQHTPGMELKAIVSTSEDKRRQAGMIAGVKAYPSLESLLLEDQVDLIIIATPHYLHAQQAIMAMNAGKHCIVDKIMCLNVREAQDMIDAAKRNGVLLSVFQNRRWDWDFLTVKKVQQSGLIGEIFRFESRVSRYKPPRAWFADKTDSGGILFNWGPHLIDQALQLVKTPLKKIYCYISHRHWPGDAGTHCQLLLHFAEDVVFEIEMSYLCQIQRPRWALLGTQGSGIQFGLDPQEAAILSGNREAAFEKPEHRMQVYYDSPPGVPQHEVIETVRGSWLDFYKNIVEVITGRAELAVKPEEVKRQIQIIETALQSAHCGQVLDFIE
jgi:scyllo-inositol 2-dehydrogenase (NADP+)